MDIAKWKYLKPEERKALIFETLEYYRWTDWHSRFEGFIRQESSIDFMNRFIGKLSQYVALDKQLGYQPRHLRAKSIVERMRDSQDGDGCTLFKVNNTYTADIAWLAILLFPNPLMYMLDVRKPCRAKIVRKWKEEKAVA